MNNVDVSIINVLKAANPDIFSLYFNEMGATPNPNVRTRYRAQQLFRAYSSESFENFMQRYRHWMAIPCSSRKDRSVSAQTGDDPVSRRMTMSGGGGGGGGEDDGWDLRRITKPDGFDVFKFLKEKTTSQDYECLNFQMETIEMDPDEMLDLKEMSTLLKKVNKLHAYRLLRLKEME